MTSAQRVIIGVVIGVGLSLAALIALFDWAMYSWIGI